MSTGDLFFLSQKYRFSVAMISFSAKGFNREELGWESPAFQEILKTTEPLYFGEGAIFIFPHNVQSSLYFIRHGVVRSYTRVEDREITRWFYGKDEMIISFQSFLYDMPSTSYMQTLAPTTILEVSKEYYNSLCVDFPDFHKKIDRLAASYMTKREEHEDRRKIYSALEMYDYFVKEHAEINLRVQIQYIASFLGITPDTLTKIRKKYQLAGRS